MKITQLAASLAVVTMALSACATTSADRMAETAAPAATPTAAAPVEVQLLALNDFHGNLEIPAATTAFRSGDEILREQLGGAARLGATLDSLRQGQPFTITVAAGDLIGASPFASANFLDEPAIMALNMAQLSVASVGNHEFDRGIAELVRIQQGGCAQYTSRLPCALEPFAGADFSYLSGNVVDSQGQSLFPGTAMRQVGPARIGFVGLTLRDTATLVSPSATQGYAFLDEADTANRLARELLSQGADMVVLLIHEGGRIDQAQNGTDCPSLTGAIVRIVERLDPAIRVVVSGHTHQAYTCELAQPDGRTTLLSSAGRYGAFVTDIRMTLDPASNALLSASAVNVPVRATAGQRADIDQMVRRYAEAAAPVAARVVGNLAPLEGVGEDCPDTPAADLVADAQLAAARRLFGPEVDVAFINTSGVRTGLAGANDGVMTYGEIFAMQPFGNVLEVLEMTGSQLRAVLEEQFCGQDLATPCFTMLAPSANMRFSYDRKRPTGHRIVDVTMDGQPLVADAHYQVVFNNFLASGGDGFASLAQMATIGEAGSDLDALEAWLAQGASVPTCGRLHDLTQL